MREDLTEVVFILDRSGSMGGLEADTIGGFNAMMEKQKKEDGEAYVSTVLFDNKVETLHDRIPIGQVPKITDKEYYVRGCTALLDAIGDTIRHIGEIHRYAREEDKPAKTLFIITTDGMENASRNYGYEEVKEMVENRQKEDGWEFIFIGANIDAIDIAGRVGIRKDHAVDYVHDETGTAEVYACMSNAVMAVRKARSGKCGQALMSVAWDRDIRDDYRKRGRKKLKK